MAKLAQTKDFCPNAACPDYGKLQSDQPKPNLKKLGKTPRGVQRFQCKTCGKTFTETKGTIFYYKHAPEEQILEVLALLAEGLPNKTIAHRLNISEHTVKFHVNAIMGKLGAQSRTEAVVRATRLGLILL